MRNEELPDEFARRVQAEIEAEADVRRRNDAELVSLEREIEKAWKGVSPGNSGSGPEHLLDRVEQLSLIEVHAPTGERFGTSQIKRLVQKLTRWYIRFVVDQLNSLHYFQGLLLRGIDRRLAKLEHEAQLFGTVEEFVEPVPEADPALCAALAQTLREADQPVAVVSCGGGAVVSALVEAGIAAHGVDDKGGAVMAGLKAGLDLRVGPPLEHLRAFADSTLGAVVLTGVVERCGVVDLLALINESLRCAAPSGTVVVAVADPAARTGVESELLRGGGLSPDAWAHLLSRRGCTVQTMEVNGSRVENLVVARTA